MMMMIIIIPYVGSIPYYGLFPYIESVGVTSKFSSVARLLRTYKQRNRFNLPYVYGISQYQISVDWLQWFICNQHATQSEHNQKKKKKS
jgi:hypothetical protein